MVAHIENNSADMESAMTFRKGVSGLIRFGKRWRGAACEALVAFGLEPPSLGEDQL